MQTKETRENKTRITNLLSSHLRQPSDRLLLVDAEPHEEQEAPEPDPTEQQTVPATLPDGNHPDPTTVTPRLTTRL